MYIKLIEEKIEAISKIILNLKNRQDKVITYKICMDCSDYDVYDILAVIDGTYLCNYKKTHDSIVSIIKQSLLINIFDHCIDKWNITDQVDMIFKTLTTEELVKLINKNLRIIQMYMVLDEYTDEEKQYYSRRTFAVNKICMNENYKLSKISNYVRWFYLYNELELTEFLLSQESCYLFLGDDYSKCKYFIFFKHNKYYHKVELVFSDEFDPIKIDALLKTYIG